MAKKEQNLVMFSTGLRVFVVVQLDKVGKCGRLLLAVFRHRLSVLSEHELTATFATTVLLDIERLAMPANSRKLG